MTHDALRHWNGYFSAGVCGINCRGGGIYALSSAILVSTVLVGGGRFCSLVAACARAFFPVFFQYR